MRIYSPQLGISWASRMGGEIFDCELLTRLAKRGAEVHVLLQRNRAAPELENFYVHRLPFDIPTSIYNIAITPWLLSVPNIRREIEKSDVLRIHSPYYGLAAGSVALKKLSKNCPPLWFHYHHVEDHAFLNFFDRRVPKHCGGITAVSEDTLRDLEAMCPEVGDKVREVTPNGIDAELFKPLPREARARAKKLAGFRDEDKIILFVGALIPRKGIDVLLECWKQLALEFRNAHLLVIGKGRMVDAIKQYQKSVERIRHIEYAERSRLVEYYGIADVFLFPTRLEGFGLAAGEAMACELPVVTTNAKGVRDLVVDEETGFTVAVDDINGLISKTRMLLSDEKLREKMGKAGRKRIQEKFSWDTTVERTINFVEKLVASRK